MTGNKKTRAQINYLFTLFSFRNGFLQLKV